MWRIDSPSVLPTPPVTSSSEASDGEDESATRQIHDLKHPRLSGSPTKPSPSSATGAHVTGGHEAKGGPTQGTVQPEREKKPVDRYVPGGYALAGLGEHLEEARSHGFDGGGGGSVAVEVATIADCKSCRCWAKPRCRARRLEL